MARAFAGYQEEAVRLMKAHPDIEAGLRRLVWNNTGGKRSILNTCGWRPVWQQYPARFQARLKDITSQRLPGSSIIFLNKVPDEAFAKLMAAVGASKKGPGAYDFAGGVALKHVVGDAAQIGILKPVIDGNSIDGCIDARDSIPELPLGGHMQWAGETDPAPAQAVLRADGPRLHARGGREHRIHGEARACAAPPRRRPVSGERRWSSSRTS